MPALPAALALLDPAELRAVEENLADARRTDTGPPARIIPESLYREIQTILDLLARELTAHDAIDPEP